MAKNEALQLARLKIKADREAQYLQMARQILASPMVQIMGTVAAAEVLEANDVLSPRWATAIETGVLASIFLQALKDYGIIGAGALGISMGAGSAAGYGDWANTILNAPGIKQVKDYMTWGLLKE